MVKKTGGARRRTRIMFRKLIGDRGKISVTRYFQKLKQGDRVQLCMEPAVQDGTYFRRFHGMIGVVKEKRGKCYEVSINDRTKGKTLIVHPIHLKKM